MTQEGASSNMKPLCMILRCTFAGGDERSVFTGEQLRYPCKLRRHICAKCGMHRGEHNYVGVRDDLLPPRKRFAFRRLGAGEFQLPGLGGSKDEKDALPLEEGKVWIGSPITKGKRSPRRKRADLLCRDSVSFQV